MTPLLPRFWYPFALLECMEHFSLCLAVSARGELLEMNTIVLTDRPTLHYHLHRPAPLLRFLAMYHCEYLPERLEQAVRVKSDVLFPRKRYDASMTASRELYFLSWPKPDLQYVKDKV